MAFVTPYTAKFIPLIDRFHESQREARLGKLSGMANSGTSSSIGSRDDGALSPQPPTSATDHSSITSSPGGRGRGETVPRSRSMKYSASEHAVVSTALPREGSGSTVSSVLSGSCTALGSPGALGPSGVRGKGPALFRRSHTVDSEDAVFSGINNKSKLRRATQGHSSSNLSKSSIGSDGHAHKGSPSPRSTRAASRSISTSHQHSGHHALTSSAPTSSLSKRAVPPPPVTTTANRTIHDAVTARGVSKGGQANRVSLAEQNVVVHDPRSPRSNKSTHSSVYGAVSGSGSSVAGSNPRSHQQALSPRVQNLETRSTRASSDMSRVGGLSGASGELTIARRSQSHEVELPTVPGTDPGSSR